MPDTKITPDVVAAADRMWHALERLSVPSRIAPPDRLPDLELVGYLHRWCLTPRSSAGNTFLHRILGPDVPVLHDHPWPFRSVVLSGWYVEHTPDDVITRHAGESHLHWATDRHYISSVGENTWTLVITGPIEREWGFWLGDRFIPHQEFAQTHQRVEAIKRHGYEVEP